MRVIAGKYRGRKIVTVEDKRLRPTTAKVRAAIFNMLMNNDILCNYHTSFQDITLIDAFCGCGSFAMEALSRGAKKMVLCDINAVSLATAKQNIYSVLEEQEVYFIKCDASKLPRSRFSCQLAFLDPPYYKGLVIPALRSLVRAGWLAQKAIIVMETAVKEQFSVVEGFCEIQDRNYGDTRIRIWIWQGCDREE